MANTLGYIQRTARRVQNFVTHGALAYLDRAGSLIALPTYLRRGRDRETFLQERTQQQLEQSHEEGGSTGEIAGLTTIGFVGCYALDQACQGNWVPAVVLSAFNAASGAVELVRGFRGRGENSLGKLAEAGE